MRKACHILLLWTTLLLLSSTSVFAEGSDDLLGKKLYTQVNMHSLKGKSITWVNYQVDSLIPVNSEVVVETIKGGGVIFTVTKTGERLKLKNKERRSGLDGYAWAKKHFAPKKRSLKRFNKLEKEGIRTGMAKIGMSKDAILVALGYPPAHKTPSLKGDYWLFWRNRWRKIGVTFTKGKVSNIR